MYLIFDTETTGLPKNYDAPLSDSENWPRLVQLAWQLHDAAGHVTERGDIIVTPEGFTIPFNAEKVHGISTQKALDEGKSLVDVLKQFEEILERSQVIIGHNISFDLNIVGAEYYRIDTKTTLLDKKVIDTKEAGTEYCKLPGGRGGKFKWPNLGELYAKLFGEGFSHAHNAAADVEATAKAFFGLIKVGFILPPQYPIDAATLRTIEENPDVIFAKKTFSAEAESVELPGTHIKKKTELTTGEISEQLENANFTHLHVHSQYSVLQSTVGVKQLVEKAVESGMKAVALTDLGNLYGAFNFVKTATDNNIKPILGCEFFLVEDRTKRKFTKEHRDHRTQIILIAKNKNGYQNLVKISSIGFMEGYYMAYPRVDKETIEKYKSDLIAVTGGIYGEIPDLILNVGETQAEEAFQWWHQQFGDDFYVELQRHGLPENDRVNETLIRFAKKYSVKCFAANDVYYINQSDSTAHDLLLCIKDGELQSTPVGRGRGFRYGFPNDQFYFKSGDEMKALFHDLPEAIFTTQEIVDKVEVYKLKRDVLLPAFKLPEGFTDQNDYLRHITYEGAKKRYPELTDEVIDRLDLELQIIKNMGFPGYFLIVADFTTQARKMGVYVGPGRGSAAGSAVAFCIGITNIDPLKYDLLFERFLNPERVSMPDIDIDFDDEGRGRILDYVVEKYGRNQVAQIITYGTLGPKMAIRDVARVMDIPLSEADRVAKLVPEKPGLSFKKAFEESKELHDLSKLQSDSGRAVKQAVVLEGSVRNTGIHACGVIIAPDELTNHVPLSISKDADLLVTQFDNKVVEDAGLLKMDFLGLKTLSILKTAIELTKENHNVEYDLDNIPLDDKATFRLYQQGDTVGTFQFESDGMRRYLRQLEPNNVEDLIAMNALYRPGPMEFIPNYIQRKHGREEVDYMHPSLEQILKPTFGIMVYQEQIMQVAQKLASYSLGEADILRRIMGKKKPDLLPPEKEKFIPRAIENGIPKETAEEVFEKMAYFAGYGFNKSHSAAYSVLAYQTAFFKANYPAEYMAAVLTHNYGDIKKVMKFIEEAARMGITIQGPNINTGTNKFTAYNGSIQYGMEAIKGVGSAAIEHVVEVRKEEGEFTSIFDFATRVDLRTCNRKTIENLIQAGAFDTLHPNRGQLLESLDDIIQYAQRKQHEEDMNQINLFDTPGNSAASVEPKLRDVPAWSNMQKLKKERELLGFFLSGHPLDKYRDECNIFCTTNLGSEGLVKFTETMPTTTEFGREKGPIVTVAGIVTSIRQAYDRKNLPIAFLEIEDEFGSASVCVFSKTYDKFKNILSVDNLLMVTGNCDNNGGRTQVIAETITRLEHVREENATKIKLRLSIDLENVEEQDFHKIANLMNSAKGESMVGFYVRQKNTKPILMNSHKYVVDCSPELLKSLRNVLGHNNVALEKAQH